MGEWLRDPRGAVVVQPVLEGMKAALRQQAEAESAPMMADEDLLAMLDGMPLGSILRFSAGKLPLPEGVTARGYIQYLLDQVYADEG